MKSPLSFRVSKQALTRCHHCSRHHQVDRSLSQAELLALRCDFCGEQLLNASAVVPLERPASRLLTSRSSRLAAGLLGATALLSACDSEDPITGGESAGETSAGETSAGETSAGETSAGKTDAPPLSAAQVAQLSRSEACTDTWVYAWDAADQVGMTIYAEGVMAQAHRDGAFSTSVDLADSAWSVQVETATGLVSMNWCVDVYGERDILRTYRATAGALQLDVAPAESGDGGYVSATLTDVVLVDEADGHSVTVPTWQISDVFVSASWGG